MQTASPVALNVSRLEEILGFALETAADTLQTLTKLEVGRGGKRNKTNHE